MSKLELIIKLACAVGGFLIAAIPSLIGLIKAIKARIKATKLAEKEAAENDLLSQLNSFIAEVEEVYDNVNQVLKARGQSAGPAKKESVLSKLRTYALDHGYDFDAEFWGEKIDEVVALTRKVNAATKTAVTAAKSAATAVTTATQLLRK